jgi:hypothetical protein
MWIAYKKTSGSLYDSQQMARISALEQKLLRNYIEQSPFWEANSSWSSQEIPCIYGAQSFITAFTRACHLTLS